MSERQNAGPQRFVVDTMLGRLAHWLRAMGYDAVYFGPAEDARLLRLARAESRVLVTRDAKLAEAAGPLGCLLRAEDVDGQVLETVAKLRLTPDETSWLSRCLACNARLEARAKDAVRDMVPPRVFAAHHEFRGCPACAKVYWAGSHADRILERLARLLRR
jgi:uncharacterized protein with PIN domain